MAMTLKLQSSRRMATEQLALAVLLFSVLQAAGEPIRALASSTGEPLPDITCQTSACVALSAGVTNKMNLNAAPCEDFYNYACGNFPVNYKYDPDDVFKSVKRTDPAFYQNAFSLMRSQMRSDLFELLMLDRVVNSTDAEVRDLYNLARMLFRSCTRWMRYRSMKDDTVAGERFFSSVLAHLLEGLSLARSNQTIESILARIVNTDVPTMFDVSVPLAYLKALKKGDQTKVQKTSRLNIAANTKQYSSNSDFEPFLEFFSTLNMSSAMSFENETSSIKNESLAFNRIIKEIQRAEKYADWADGCSISFKRKQYKISDLDVLSRCANPRNPFSWRQFFTELLHKEYDPDTLVELKTPIKVINFVSYLKKRTVYTTSDKLTSYHTLLIMDWLLSFARFLPRKQERLWEETPLRDKVMEKAPGGAVDACMKWTKDLLSPVVERMYYKAYLGNIDQVQKLIELLQKATATSVLEQDWIEQTTKEIILRKLKLQKHSIGFDVLSADELKTFYAQAISSFRAGSYSKISVDKNFGRLFSIALSASARKKFNVVTENGSVTAFLMLSPLTTNAYNYMRRNQIVFPLGILAAPMYHSDYPDYMNLGGLGVVIGHEIGHAFDTKGHRLNEEGARGDFWDNTTLARYLRRTDCIKSRYGTYELVPGVPHRSNTTQGNDISDTLGLRSAFGALQLLGDKGKQLRLPNMPSNLTPDKLFFVQAAQAWCMKAEPSALLRRFPGIKHSPPHLRVRGMIQNSAAFARAFECRPGQAMNPGDKCEFW